MKIPGLDQLRAGAQSLTNSLDHKALILMYHRIADVRTDPWSLCVTPGHFREQLEVLQEQTRPLKLQQLAKSLQTGIIPDRSVIITFDDGYPDNLYNARPLLERYQIPATVFIATGYLEDPREFWWDELATVLLQAGTLPDVLRLNINGSTHQWELGEATHYDVEDCCRYSSWRAWEDAPTPRHALYRALWEKLQPLSDNSRREVLDEFLMWAGVRPKDPAARTTLSPEGVVALAREDLVEVGSHTVTHPVLSALSPDLQRDEIHRSKAALDDLLGRPVRSFAYPYGAPTNYTSETIAIVREAGYSCACSTVASAVERNSDLFQLPRLHVQDWDSEEFARHLSVWFGRSTECAHSAGSHTYAPV